MVRDAHGKPPRNGVLDAIGGGRGDVRFYGADDGQRQAVTKKNPSPLKSDDCAGKPRILDELVELTSWHRDYLRGQRRGPYLEPGNRRNRVPHDGR